MRITFLSKRQYMQKDVIDDRYARLYELPNQLARRGHPVQGICLSYRKREAGHFVHYQEGSGSLEWHAFNLGYLFLPGLMCYLNKLLVLIDAFKPDVLVGSSDCPHVIVTAWAARRLKIPFFIDLYDNFESFGLAKIPGMVTRYRQAITQAEGVSCVSQPLSDYVKQLSLNPNVLTLPSTINLEQFYPRDQTESRRALGLPKNGKLIGVAGSLASNRGINLLYDAFIELAVSDKNIYLVLAGPVDNACPIPHHPRVIYLGMLAHEKIPVFYSALDLATVCMIDTEFGRYAFPQKTYEILACRTPIVTANLGALKAMFSNYPNCLYVPGDAEDFQRKILLQLEKPEVLEMPIPTWSDEAKRLERFLTGHLKAIDAL